ncbi:hypothetical protein [Leptospira idonii]|uniref:hypothetical protein n=1 Tax=Leptospira idonii TaxID=1193500 RepID=UPI0014383CC5|nr:hypothetical protein [Leptospira idonii]
MKKISILLGILFVTAGNATLFAKCYGFRDTDIKVCVEGDGFAERKKAGEICKFVK